MRIKKEFCANRVLAESVNAGAIVQRGPRINRATLRAMRAERRRYIVGEVIAGAAFVFLFALCFAPMFINQ